MIASSTHGERSLARLIVSCAALVALLGGARVARADGPPLEEAPAPELAPPALQDDDPEPPRLAPPPPPLPLLPLLPPQTGRPEASRPPHRGLGIGLIVLGNVIQFAGVSLLVPAVLHKGDSSWSQRGPLYFGVGGGLDGLGNVVEAVGWGLAFGRRAESRPPVAVAER